MAANVRDFGAAGDGATLDTRAIQAAIDACAGSGGGTVVLPAGRYPSGTITLASHVTLHLEAGAVLLGSQRIDDYRDDTGIFVDAAGRPQGRALVYAEGAESVSIEGRGAIDGQGAAFKAPLVEAVRRGDDPPARPFLARFKDCRNVRLTDITLRDSASWVSHYLRCEDVAIRGVTIRSHANFNNDGMDIDSCRRVRVSDCDVSSHDDAICLKTTSRVPCEDVVVSNCAIDSKCGALKLGTESIGDFRNICMTNCVISNTALGGLKLMIMDGARAENLIFSNLCMTDVTGPIFMRLGDRGRTYLEGDEPRREGAIRNVIVSNVIADVSAVPPPELLTDHGVEAQDRLGILIAGLPERIVENVVFDNVQLTLPGGQGPANPAREIPEHPDRYPELGMFGQLPAYGLFARHVRGLTVRDTRFTLAQSDARPPVSLDDVSDATIDNLSAPGWPPSD